jgi:hypothetical protein
LDGDADADAGADVVGDGDGPGVTGTRTSSKDWRVGSGVGNDVRLVAQDGNTRNARRHRTTARRCTVRSVEGLRQQFE